MDYRQIEKIASDLEKRLNAMFTGDDGGEETKGVIEEGGDEIQDSIENDIEQEKKKNNLPEPSLPACAQKHDDDGGVVEEKTVLKCAEDDGRIAELRRLAHEVRISSEMTADEKRAAFVKIHRVAKGISVRKNDLTKTLGTDVTKIMKSISSINNLVQDERKEKHTLRAAVNEMRKWGDENGIDIDFPENLLGRSLGSFSTSDIIELGPRIATMLQEYKTMKDQAEAEAAQQEETGEGEE